jgi:unsaturated rhamnogalacturonyl hydrolase
MDVLWTRFRGTFGNGSKRLVSAHWYPYSDHIGLYGLVNYYALKSATNPNDPHAVTTLRLVKDWYAARAAEGCTTKNINTMAVFLSLVTLMDLDNTRGGVFTPVERETYLGWIDEWGEWAMNDLDRTEMGGFQHITFRLVNENQLWDDTLMMTVLSLAKIGKLLNRPQYIEEGECDMWRFVLTSQPNFSSSCMRST